MNQSKKIEVSKSSLISLKAELLRKQDEVQKAKLENRNQIENFVPSSKFAKETSQTSTSTPSSSKKEPRDAEESEILRKSRETLERKTKLYDHLMQSSSSSSDLRDEQYLVEFEKKKADVREQRAESPDDEHESQDDSDEEWVDYVDCLGRTRRCHKSDLEHVQKQDKHLQVSLKGREKVEEIATKKWVSEGESSQKELESPDPHKEVLKKQWEEKEQELLTKQNVHYEDVLFNEARAHGVGYYSLSGDATERARQQSELAAARKDTEKARVATAEARQRREEALQARVKAARARQRARAGLPPEEEEPVSSVTSLLLDFVEEQKKVSSEQAAEEGRKKREAREEEAKKERDQFVREWDLGKEKQAYPKHVVLTQEQWVDKKRQERIKDFAPPQSTSGSEKPKARTFDNKGFFVDTRGDWGESSRSADTRMKGEDDMSKAQKSEKFLTSTKKSLEEIKNKYVDLSVNKGISDFEPVPIRNECSDDDDDEGNESKKTGVEESRKRGVEIEPPSTYEYYGPAEKKGKPKGNAKANVTEAFAMGVKYLEEQAASKDKRKKRGLLDE